MLGGRPPIAPSLGPFGGWVGLVAPDGYAAYAGSALLHCRVVGGFGCFGTSSRWRGRVR